MRLSFALLILFLFAPQGAAAEPLRVGFAEVDVTPRPATTSGACSTA